MYTTIKEIRKAFWDAHPEIKNEYRKTYRQNDYKPGVRTMFVNFVDMLERNGEITTELASKATL